MANSPSSPAHAAARTLRRYRFATGGALLFLYAIVVTGATVRLTGSGLGCPDWPACHGSRPVPSALTLHPLVEFGNRMVSTPTLAFSLAAFVLALRLRPLRRDLRWGSGLALAGVVVQIVLGGLSVLLHLAPLLVAVHFLVSIGILMAATWAWHASSSATTVSLARRLPAGGEDTGRDRALVVATATLLAVAALVIVGGVLTTASGPHSGGSAGQAVHRLGIWHLAVAAHARLSFLFTGLVVGITVWRRRSRAGARDLGLLTLLVLGQIALGEYQFRNGLPWQVVLAHVANATLLWCVVCTIAWRAAAVPVRTPATGPGPDPSPSGAEMTATLPAGPERVLPVR